MIKRKTALKSTIQSIKKIPPIIIGIQCFSGTTFNTILLALFNFTCFALLPQLFLLR